MIAFLDILDTQQEKEEFILLYERYNKLVMWISMQKLNGRTALAEECVQETFLYIAKNFHKIEGVESDHTKSYVATVAEGFAIKCYKKEHKLISVSIEEDYMQSESAEEELSAFAAAELSSVMGNMADEDRNLLWLKYVYGLSSREMANIYGVSDALIRKRISAARKKLKDIMEGEN